MLIFQDHNKQLQHFRTTATTMTFCLSSPTAAVSPEGSLLSAEKKNAAREAQGGKMICRGTWHLDIHKQWKTYCNQKKKKKNVYSKRIFVYIKHNIYLYVYTIYI